MIQIAYQISTKFVDEKPGHQTLFKAFQRYSVMHHKILISCYRVQCRISEMFRDVEFIFGLWMHDIILHQSWHALLLPAALVFATLPSYVALLSYASVRIFIIVHLHEARFVVKQARRKCEKQTLMITSEEMT